MNGSTTIETDRAPVRARPRGAAGRLAAALSGAVARLAFVAGLGGGLAAGWIALPALLYERTPQPLDFDHAVHTQDGGMACDECHGFRADGSFAGVPATALCVDCHEEALGDSPHEQRLIALYLEPGREIPWLVDARQPQNVHFSHAAHVRLAEIPCARCHGDRGTSASLPPHETNRISTYSRSIWGPRIAGGGPGEGGSMKMSDCSACHASRGIRDHCLMCHK